MNTKEKIILKKAIESKEGLLSGATLINVIASRERQSVENLVVGKYLEEVPRELRDNNRGSYIETFYRVTAKGLAIFSPWYVKCWSWLQHDVRTIVLTIITAAITTVVTMSVQNFFE